MPKKTIAKVPKKATERRKNAHGGAGRGQGRKEGSGKVRITLIIERIIWVAIARKHGTGVLAGPPKAIIELIEPLICLILDNGYSLVVNNTTGEIYYSPNEPGYNDFYVDLQNIEIGNYAFIKDKNGWFESYYTITSFQFWDGTKFVKHGE